MSGNGFACLNTCGCWSMRKRIVGVSFFMHYCCAVMKIDAVAVVELGELLTVVSRGQTVRR